MRFIGSLFFSLLVLSTGALLPAASAPDFGAHEWVNSEPLTATALKGKMAVLRFYEEGCPTCRATWADINKAAVGWKADKHLILIAVNSGTPKGQVQAYAQSVKLNDWRILVDTDRTYEKNFGFTISLQNIYQAVFLAPDGSVTPIHATEPAMSTDIQRLYDQHKDQVKWKIAPAEAPAKSQALWQAFEFEQWATVMKELPAAQRATDAETKAFAAKLDTAIKAEIEQRQAAAKAKLDAGEKWAAFKDYEGIVADFGRTNDTREAYNQTAKLRSDRKVTLEFAGRDLLVKSKAMLADPNQKKNAEAYLKSIVDNYKDTEAAAQAQALLTK